MKFTAFVLVLLVVLACAGSRRESPPPPPKVDSKPAKLQAEVHLSESGVVVKNTDAFDFALTAKLNLKDMGGDDGRASATVPQGTTVTITYGEFTVGTTRFSAAKTKIMTVYLKSGETSRLFLCPGSNCVPADSR